MSVPVRLPVNPDDDGGQMATDGPRGYECSEDYGPSESPSISVNTGDPVFFCTDDFFGVPAQDMFLEGAPGPLEGRPDIPPGQAPQDIGFLRSDEAAVGIAADVAGREEVVEELEGLRGLLDATPIEEDEERPPATASIELQTLYFMNEQRPDGIYGLFADLVRSGWCGLCITRQNPRKVQKACNIPGMSLIWLTSNHDPAITCIEPTSLISLAAAVTSFLENTEKGIVVMDGIEYLITQNSFGDVLKYVQVINDKLMMSNSSMVVSLDAEALDEKGAHLLEHEMYELKSPCD